MGNVDRKLAGTSVSAKLPVSLGQARETGRAAGTRFSGRAC
jgi:hypothetical protein